MGEGAKQEGLRPREMGEGDRKPKEAGKRRGRKAQGDGGGRGDRKATAMVGTVTQCLNCDSFPTPGIFLGSN